MKPGLPYSRPAVDMPRVFKVKRPVQMVVEYWNAYIWQVE